MIEKMTLGEFIKRMKNGWGFARPFHVVQIAETLEEIIPQEDYLKEVQVKFIYRTTGSGPTHRYHYRWEVRGYKLPVEIFGPTRYYYNSGEDYFVVEYSR